MSAEDEAFYTCPACGEDIAVPIDTSAGSVQEYIEDCPVCCRPVVLRVDVDRGGDVRIAAQPE